MFEITPLPEFSAWFETLSPPLAEEVACELELVAEAGIALGPSRASRALLWFDAVGGPLSEPWLEFARSSSSSLACRAAAEVRELVLWQREVVRGLESPAFRRRLAELEPRAASIALQAIESLKQRLKTANRRIALRHPAARNFASLRADELRDGYFQVLRLVGLEPTPTMNSLSGLCELNIPTTEPPLRVLFGLDAPGQRVVVLLGEALTRRHYGDSVNLAERRWQQYCANPKLAPTCDL